MLRAWHSVLWGRREFAFKVHPAVAMCSSGRVTLQVVSWDGRRLVRFLSRPFELRWLRQLCAFIPVISLALAQTVNKLSALVVATTVMK